MSQTAITLAFEQWKASQAVTGESVLLDEFVFANVPGLNTDKAIDRNEGLPPAAQIVHRQAVSRKGVVNENAVVHSVVLGADVGDFSFNWVGLINKASNTLAMIVHAPLQQKLKTKGGQQGNVLTRSFLMEYNGAQTETGINTPAETWQIDFTARMAGMDERQRVENIDLYGAAAFLGDGWLVAKSGSQFYVTAGAGYVRGLRAQLAANQNITVTTKPVKVWLDVAWTGTLTSAWAVSTKITVAASLDDYVQNGVQHYVFAVASIDANGNITDLRPKGSLDSQGANADFLKKDKNLTDVDDKDEARKTLSAAKKGDNSDITSLSGLTTALSLMQGGTGAKTAKDARKNLELNRFIQADVETQMLSPSGGHVLRLWDNGVWGVFDVAKQEWTPLPVEKGGTGAITASAARKNLQAAQLGANSDITSISGLTTALSVPQGGTGATTAKEAREKLFAAERGGNSDITSLSGLTTALSVSQGGTGSKTATGARQNLELDRFAQAESETHMNSASRRYVLRLWDNGTWGVFDSTNQEWMPLPLEKGGTGAITASGARKNLQAAQLGANSDITSISGLTTALSVPQGGTGATSAKEAREKLFAAERGGNSDITSLSGLTTALSVSQGGTGAKNAADARGNISAASSGDNADITAIYGLTTALSVAQGGTGAKTATAARANLYAGGIPTALNADSGWWKCADTGRIFQHGKVVIQSGGRITFPAAFPNKCCAVILTDNDGYKDCGVLGATTTYAPFTSNQSGLVTVGYLAVGY
nr:MAG TPA: Tail fiber protein [Caudoviricetes sp.]